MQFSLGRFVLFVCTYLMALPIFAAESVELSHYAMRLNTLYCCGGLMLLIFIILMYALVTLRKSKGNNADHFHKCLGIEILWTLTPFLISIALVMPSYLALQHEDRAHQVPVLSNVIK